MTSYVPPKKNDANGFVFYTALSPRTANGTFLSNPTLAAGDVKVSIDGGAFANLGTLPAVTPAAGVAVKVTLAQAEINGDNIYVKFVDAAGAEWCDKIFNFQTVTKQIDDLATQVGVDDIPTNAELATALAAADDATLAAIAALNNISAAGVRAAVGLASANLDTQLDALPTNAELTTALGTADDAVLAAIAALNNLSQANIRTALGLASANLDTQLDALPTNAELATSQAAADDATLAAIAALSIPTANQNASALLDLANAIETGVTVRGILRGIGAVLLGKASGGQTGTETFRNMVADSKDRVVSTNDAQGNRSSVTVDMT